MQVCPPIYHHDPVNCILTTPDPVLSITQVSFVSNYHYVKLATVFMYWYNSLHTLTVHKQKQFHYSGYTCM